MIYRTSLKGVFQYVLQVFFDLVRQINKTAPSKKAKAQKKDCWDKCDECLDGWYWTAGDMTCTSKLHTLTITFKNIYRCHFAGVSRYKCKRFEESYICFLFTHQKNHF